MGQTVCQNCNTVLAEGEQHSSAECMVAKAYPSPTVWRGIVKQIKDEAVAAQNL